MIVSYADLSPPKSAGRFVDLGDRIRENRNLGLKFCPATGVALFEGLYWNENNAVARFPGSSTVEHSAVDFHTYR